jgi:uncharacterized protein
LSASFSARLVRLAASWTCIAVGVPMLVRAELGLAPADVLNSGVSTATGWSFGTSFVVMAVTLYSVGLVLGGRIGWASPLGTVVIGPMINVVLGRVQQYERLVFRIPLFAVGTLVIAAGICLAIAARFGPGPSEVVQMGLVHRGIGLVIARWIVDGVPIVLGVLLGGQIGAGTVIFLVVMGPLIKSGLKAMHFVPPVRAADLAST